jgi:DNA-binding transcriptional LysR family regulator
MNLLEAYRYLAALDLHRHFGRAAAACHITQPALSNALRSLEAHYEAAIVRRGRVYEGLTPEGRQVLATAHRVLREQEALQQELRSSAAHPRGGLVIGCVPTALPIAMHFAAKLIARHPGLRPQVRSLTSQEIEARLETLAIDLGLGYTQRVTASRASRVGSLTVTPQYDERYFAVRRSDAPGTALRLAAPLTWARAAKLPLALLSPEMHNRAILDGVFARLKLRVEPLLETNSVTALLTAIRHENLATVLPGAVVSMLRNQPGLKAWPLTSPEVHTPIGFMHTGQALVPRALQTALGFAVDEEWRCYLAQHSGALGARVLFKP